MKENKAVGPNLKTYYYYTNEMADSDAAKASIVIATGNEGTGALYDEIGDYLDKNGYALYAIDEWGYGKTGDVAKENKKNWKRKGFHYASYNIHSLSVMAKRQHPDAPVYLIGNDFGAMLSIYLLKEFPEVVDKVVTIGWGAPRGQDFGFLFTSWLKKLMLYDNGESKWGHASINKRFALRFERGEKYAWLSSDLDQVKKIRDAGYIDIPGTIGHNYYYFSKKVKIPMFTKLKKMDRNTPMLLLSGSEDLFTKKGLTTKTLGKYLKIRKFNNITTMVTEGRHQLLFEKNRFETMDKILTWLTGSEVSTAIEETDIQIVAKKEPETEVVVETIEAEVVESVVNEVEVVTPVNENTFMEAEEDLLIRTNKESE